MIHNNSAITDRMIKSWRRWNPKFTVVVSTGENDTMIITMGTQKNKLTRHISAFKCIEMTEASLERELCEMQESLLACMKGSEP